MRHSVVRSGLLALTLILAPYAAQAAPADDAVALVGQWAAAFNAGEIDKIVATYAADATVHGTTSPNLAAGSDAVRAYFVPALRSRTQVKLDGSGTATSVTPDVVVLAGYYEFSGTRPDGQAFVAPARYSFVLAKRGDGWSIIHHHSSPRPRP